MNNVKAIQKINEAELRSGTKKSWHDMYHHSAYIFIGGLNYDLTEGDVLAVFSQYGEIININLVRDKKTGKPKGFCFICYEDQRSTILAVDNLNGIKLCGRTLRVDHVNQYRRPKDESGNEIIEKGCAPKTPTPSPTPSPVMSPEPVKEKPKKIKKLSKDKKKKKKKIKQKYRHSDSDSDGHSSPDSEIGNARFSSKRSDVGGGKWAKGDETRESLKERKGKTWDRDDTRGRLSPSPPPKRKSAATILSEKSVRHSLREPGPSTSRSRQSYRESKSRSRSRSRDRGRRNRRTYYRNDREHAKADRSRSRSRDRSEHRENNFNRSGKTKHTHK